MLAQVMAVPWDKALAVADLGCGTGRTGAWLRQQAVGAVDGVDCTPEMLDLAAAKGIYRRLVHANLLGSPLPAGAYGAVTCVLAVCHLADLKGLYLEAARLVHPGGFFVLVDFHPFCLLNGMPTSFDMPDEMVAIENVIHLFSDHVMEGSRAGWRLLEMYERLVDEEWVRELPDWADHAGEPISFLMVWQAGE